MRPFCLLSLALAAAAGAVVLVGYCPKAATIDDEPDRCRALTRRGERCRRPARPGGEFCSQHIDGD